MKTHETRVKSYFRGRNTRFFEEDGSIITKVDSVEYRRNGRDYIMKVIKFFEAKDRSIYYKMCAKLKIVLDDYDMKFGKKEIDSI